MAQCHKKIPLCNSMHPCLTPAAQDEEFCWRHKPGYQTPLERCRAENAKFTKALMRIDTWSKAYPLDIFPKPDMKAAAKVLKAAGMTLDAITADNMRHVLDGIKDIVSEALKE